MIQYSPSIDIRPEWSVLEQVQVPLFAKMTIDVPEPTDYEQCGSIHYYDRAIDRVSPHNKMPLVRSQAAFKSVTASEDPILKKISSELKARVFFTDSVLTALMCTQRSVYSWDMIIERRGDELWFDKRPGSVLDQESVNETAPEGVPEDDSINGVAALAAEATAIRQNFSQQCLDRTQTLDLGSPNPFTAVCCSCVPETSMHAQRCTQLSDEDALSASGTRPRTPGSHTFTVSLFAEHRAASRLCSAEGTSTCAYAKCGRAGKREAGAGVRRVQLPHLEPRRRPRRAVRCVVDGVLSRQGTDFLLTVRSFNQAMVGASDVDWKRKLEHQSAAVLAMEVKNNSNRVARWTLGALLAGCDLMKARAHPLVALDV
jgi:Eukaryotic translation initiation factor 3 subunit 7 (eIF-3)